MVLKIPGPFTMFPQSRYEGLGFGAEINQKIKDQGPLGPSKVTLMHGGFGTLVNTAADTELESYTFAPHAFKINEMVYIEIEAYQANGNPVTCYPRVTDSAGSVDFDNITDSATIYSRGEFRFGISPVDNNKITKIVTIIKSSTIAGLTGVSVLTDENWLTKAWKISLRAECNGGTLYYSWRVYRIGET